MPSTYQVTVLEDRKEWRWRGVLHRIGGPAVEKNNGDIAYYFNGKVHRTDGPAVICADGTKGYFLNGLMHNEEGPALIHGELKDWYINGKKLTEDEFNMYLILKNAFPQLLKV